MASFIDTMIASSVSDVESGAVSARDEAERMNALFDDRKRAFEEKRDARRHELMVGLTDKYHGTIKRGIEAATRAKKREKFINFEFEDFKANCSGLGTPKDVMRMWIDDMCNPESDYVPVDESGKKIHFSGLTADIWGGRTFTTRFTW